MKEIRFLLFINVAYTLNTSEFYSRLLTSYIYNRLFVSTVLIRAFLFIFRSFSNPLYQSNNTEKLVCLRGYISGFIFSAVSLVHDV